MSTDQTQTLQDQIKDAAGRQHPLQIIGGNSKAFLGRKASIDDVINTQAHSGIISYEPGELTLTARAGTLLKDIEILLADHNQMLAFEPPHFSDAATLGGTIACNLSGPRRAYAGAARDFVLGSRIINGKGEAMRFGGEVIKNVAGYDVSRLMTGAMGTLGLILDVSLKVLPIPEQEITFCFELSSEEAIAKMNQWAGKSLPLSATCYDGERLYVRLSGTSSATQAAAQHIGGESVFEPEQFWQELREQTLPFFDNEKLLWRLSVPSTTVPLNVIDDLMLIEWGGAQRWCLSEQHPEDIRKIVEEVGGHAAQYRRHEGICEVFHPLSSGVQQLHRNLKTAFDPHNILNPGRQYLDL